MRLRRFCLIVVLSATLTTVLAAQQSPQGESDEELQPAPYEQDEFADWMHELRRAEIVAVGSFPVTVLLGAIAYEIGRFGVLSIAEGRVQADIAPLFFRTNPEPTFDAVEQRGILIGAAVMSGLIAGIDWLIGRAEERR